VIHHHSPTKLPTAQRESRLVALRRVFPDCSNTIIITSGDSSLTIIRSPQAQ
jgi:hypothetical protein